MKSRSLAMDRRVKGENMEYNMEWLGKVNAIRFHGCDPCPFPCFSLASSGRSPIYSRSCTIRHDMLCKIFIVHIQHGTREPDHADHAHFMAPTRQHDLDHAGDIHQVPDTSVRSVWCVPGER